MNTPDYDKELKELKEEIRKVVGEKELERIMNDHEYRRFVLSN